MFDKKIIKVDVLFLSINSTVFDIGSIKIQAGQVIKVMLDTPLIPAVSWSANNDEVLDIEEHNNFSIIKAASVGKSTIEFQVNEKILQVLEVEVTPKAATSVKFVAIIKKK